MLKDTVIALHEQLLAEFGGSPGLRDEGLLDSALARPRHRHAYEAAGLPGLAASYALGLVACCPPQQLTVFEACPSHPMPRTVTTS